jgi:F-type H+-transporting ATPase subunit delta
MSTTISSKRYAQAVFSMAKEQNEIDKWQVNLKKIASVMTEPEFIGIVENPGLSFELKTELVREKLGKISPLALNLAYLLIQKNKCKISPQIAEHYERLTDEYHRIKRAEITTAVPLNNTEKGKLEHRLETITDNKIITRFRTDPDIIGGIVARIDGRLLDGSIRSKLDILRKSLRGT